ncbi:hypothetical protein SISSUDRAFT_1128695 [Sistotremastrum suecicum HHB10207 ss-3]|uniref:Arrestin-like N-terminal domain-containing protein n=1 Tax=Sistotremastrum suecicum HHB10207 ss-3 TaxID=1314776 RepID=A0A166DK77_9AGAM|nr:hypothetical protein SISSUDRAFT_1128695 [Sistotremastrum suecicum HHB10207 ss-3]
MVNHGITLNFSPSLRTPKSTVEGSVDLDVGKIKERGIVAVTASLVGVLRTSANLRSINDRVAPKSASEWRTLVNLRTTLWQLDTNIDDDNADPSSMRLLNIPFSFTMPDDPDLPPSFDQLTDNGSASIKYYIQIVGKLKAWYKLNIWINRPFTFVPFDDTPPPSILGANTRTWREEVSIRRSLFGGRQAKVEVELILPDLPSLPLYQPIPIQLHIHCYSKPLPQSSSSDPSTFQFPKPPTSAHDISLRLYSFAGVTAETYYATGHEDRGLVAGFGVQDKKALKQGWNDNVTVDVSPPIWILEGDSKKEGRWTQEVTFNSLMTLQCPPSFKHGLVHTSYHLQALVPFPGLGNNVLLKTSSLKISSGLYRDGEREHDANLTLDLPPSYWEVSEAHEA